MSEINDIKKNIGDKKDLETFIKSDGGKKMLKELRQNIAMNIFKIPNIKASNMELLVDLIATIKSDIRTYRKFITASDEVDSLVGILTDFENEE